jgi:predicted alpha/beta hydrolase family esterase
MGNISNCIIIHGSPQSQAKWVPIGDKKRWITWVKEELEKKGIPTYTPNMPVPWEPVYKDWKEAFEKLPVNENSILIGHSAGGAFLPRWLGENQQRIKKLILVAPGKKMGNYPNAEHNRDLYNFEINPEVKDRVGEIIIFTSPEEPAHRQENILLYQELFGAKVVSLPGKGHYTFDDMKTDEFPELLEEILK